MIIICSNKNNIEYNKYLIEKNKTEVIKNIKQRNIKIKKKDCDGFELRIVNDNMRIIKSYNYFPTFRKLYKYLSVIKQDDINYSLYSNDNYGKSAGVGFKDEETAIKSINKIKNKDITYQKQVITTLYNRAKYHPHQTNNIRKAMKIFKKFLNNI
jgi:hypothetical protein